MAFAHYRLLLQLLLSLLCLYMSAPSHAAINLEGPRFDLNITDQSAYLEDTSSSLTPDSFLGNAVKQQLTPIRTPYFREGFTLSTLWLHVRIQNQQPMAQTALLYVNQPNLGHFTVWQRHGSVWQLQGETGSKASPIHALFRHRAPLLPITLAPATSSELLIRLDSPLYLNFALHLSDPQSFYSQQFASQLFAGIGAGLLLLLLVAGITLASLRRSATYALFAALMATLFLYMATSLGYVGYYWWPIPGLHAYLELIALTLYCGFLLLSNRAALHIGTYNQTLSWIMLSVGLLILLLALGGWLLSSLQLAGVCALAGMISVALSTYATAIRLMEGLKSARALLLANCLLLALGGITVQNVFGMLAFPFDTRWLLLSSMVIQASVLLWVLMQQDRKAQHQRELVTTQARLQEAEQRASCEFLGHISHEIRTPMNGILGMSELLRASSLSQSQKDYVNTIQVSGNNLLSIIDNVLNYARLLNGSLTVDQASFDIYPLLTTTLDNYRDRVADKHIELIVNIDESLPAQVKSDPDCIKQALSHVLANAIRFTDRGEIRLDVMPAPECGSNCVTFQVTDTGIGMHPKQLAALLTDLEEPAPPNRSQGLGIPITRRLVALLGGTLEAESQLSRGTTVRFTIPLEPDPEGEDMPLVTDQLDGLRLLAVDDNASCRLVIEQQASSWGMNAEAVADGKRALALLDNRAALQQPFDVVVLDYEMPGMNGMEVAARICQDTVITNDPLILMLTGVNEAPSNADARNVGIRRVLSKPVTGRQLKLTILEELSHLRRIRQNSGAASQALEALPAMHILVAEDDVLSQKVVTSMLKRLGVTELTQVNTGSEAFKAFQEHSFDVILMDCEMPEMSGFEAAQKIRALEQASNLRPTPIIALTAHIMDTHKEQALQAGMDAHLSKPLELGELRNTLRYWYNHAQARHLEAHSR